MTAATAATTALRGARLFDGHRMVADPVVAMRGSTVVAVGEDVPSDIPVTDLGDVTLLPGLVDCHQHLCFDGTGSLHDQVATVSDQDLLERARANAVRALHAGITTLRDLGDRAFVTLALRGRPGLPTILAAGPPLTTPGGHCWFLGGECAGADELVLAVRERHRRGCDVVKIMVTGGARTADSPMWRSQFGTDELGAVVRTAHELGLPVAAHCHGIDGTALAVELGVDTLEHCTFFSAAGRSEPDAALIAAIAASGIAVSATLARDPAHPAPPIIEANLAACEHGWRLLYERGAALVVGTDAGVGPGKPHDVLPFAAEELAELGMGGPEVLAALTSAAADACGVGDRKGRLRPGYDADIIAVHDDPTRRPRALRTVGAVWHQGVRIR